MVLLQGSDKVGIGFFFGVCVCVYGLFGSKGCVLR